MLVQEYQNGVLVNEYDDGTPEPELDPQSQKIADLEATVTALTEQATGKITKAQLATRLATLSTAVENAVSKGDEIQAAREAVE